MARAESVVGFTRSWRAPTAVALAACVAFLAVWLSSGSTSSDHARTAVQSLFVNPATAKKTAQVQSCGQIGANIDARIYMCQVVTTSCMRFFQFAVYRDAVYGASPVFAPAYALMHPCTPLHT